MYRITLYVPGICCFDRLHSIEKEIRGFAGIISFKSSMPKGKLVIEFKPSLVSSMKIIESIEEHGFTVVKKDQREYFSALFD
jgi:copper chaperone CopZ